MRRKIRAYSLGLNLVVVSVVMILIMPEVLAQDNYNFGSETVNKGYSAGSANRNAEDVTYQTLTEADQYPNTNFSGSSENVVTGTGGGAAFPGALDTDDASRRSYTEANTAGGSPTYQIIRPNADGTSITMTTYPASPTTHYTKVNEVTKNDETSYNAGVATSGGEKDIYGMADPSDPGGTPNIDVTMWIWARGVTASQCSLTYGLYIGTSSYIGATPLITTTTYTNYSYTWTLNPSTSAEWTFAQLASVSTYLLGVDGNPDTHTTQVAILITFTPTATYQLDAQITYSGVTSTSQTISYMVYCQGYRSAAENFYVQAWNYIGSVWDTKITVQAASDTDYDFALTSDQRSSGANEVKLRILDVSGGDAVQDIVYFDVLKVNRIEKGYALDVEMTASSLPSYGNLQLRIKGYTSTETFNVKMYNWGGSTWSADIASITALSNTWVTYDFSEATYLSGSNQVSIRFLDGSSQTSDTTVDILYLDVVWVSHYHADPTITEYGRSPPNPLLTETIHWWMTYTDADNEPPSSGYPKVHIDSTDYSMTENESDTIYWDGKTYYFDKSDLAGGDHSFYFIAKDATSGEITTSSTPFKVNRNPTLTDDGVTPDFGVSEDEFSFFVTYTDLDGDAPSYIRVNINSYDFDMIANGTGDYYSGYPYHYEKELAGGDHTYYFKTKDANGTEVTTTPKDLFVDNPPELTLFGLAPSPPFYHTTELNFTISYTDVDDNAPLYVNWREDTGTTQNVTMLEVDAGDTTYTDGKAYYLLRYLSRGDHYYDFCAMELPYPVFVQGGSNSLTVLNSAPIITSTGNTTQDYDTFMSYHGQATDADTDMLSWEFWSNATWLSLEGSYVNGTAEEGYWHCKLWANDSYGGSDLEEWYVTVGGPPENNPPTLANFQRTPVDPVYVTTLLNFTVNYSDIDNELPTDIRWREDSGATQNLTMNQVDELDEDVTDGKWYYIELYLGHGIHDFDYTASDGTIYVSGGSDSITIQNRAPQILSSGNTTQIQGTYMSYLVIASDPDGDDITIEYATNSSLVLDGWYINGTCSGLGVFWNKVWVNDSYSGSDEQDWDLTVYENQAPYFTSTPDNQTYNNTEYEYLPLVTDPDYGPNPLTYSLSTNATWLQINSTTGRLNGTSDQIGSFWVNITVSDGNIQVSQNWTLEVNEMVEDEIVMLALALAFGFGLLVVGLKHREFWVLAGPVWIICALTIFIDYGDVFLLSGIGLGMFLFIEGVMKYAD